MAKARLQIAGTYKRKVSVPFPGAGTEPEMVEIVAVFNDVDPDEQETEQEKLDRMLALFNTCIRQLRDDKPDVDQLTKADEELAGLRADGVKPLIERVLAGVELPEGVEVIGKDGEPLEGKALLDFAKRYPRWRTRFLEKYNEENGEDGGAALGNSLRSGRLMRA